MKNIWREICVKLKYWLLDSWSHQQPVQLQPPLVCSVFKDSIHFLLIFPALNTLTDLTGEDVSAAGIAEVNLEESETQRLTGAPCSENNYRGREETELFEQMVHVEDEEKKCSILKCAFFWWSYRKFFFSYTEKRCRA